MKHLIFTFLLIGFFSFESNAQFCKPDAMYKDSSAGVYPKPSVGIDKKACVNTKYDYTFTVVVSKSIPYLGLEIPLYRVGIDTVGAVDNLPKGITYKCDPPNCQFDSNTRGCIILTGIPTAVNVAPFNYDLKIKASAYTAISPLPLTIEFPGTFFPGNYYLRLLPEGNDSCKISANNDLLANDFQTTIKPNPFSNETNISFVTEVPETITFSVYNQFGAILNQRKIESNIGENNILFDAKDLNGLYYYSLQSKERKSVGKLLIIK